MKLSICITVKNRSRIVVNEKEILLFPNCVQSIINSIPPSVSAELIVSDWQSDDWPLSEWFYQKVKSLPAKIISVNGSFNRGKGRNIAAKAASGDYLLFLDADCLLCSDVIASGIKYLQQGKAFFPVVYSFTKPDHKEGEWSHYGYGNCMVTKEMWAVVEWPEYAVWGKEDDHFYLKIAECFEIAREEVKGFYHQWHPDDIVWKNKYSEHVNEIANEIGQVKVAKEEILATIPSEGSFILIDEGRFGGSGCIADRRDFQFPEVNGEYAGAPADSEAAIQEVERLLNKGASFIVIAWMAFWWLDHYTHFNEYLRKNYLCVLENERLVVFGLNKNNVNECYSYTHIENVQVNL